MEHCECPHQPKELYQNRDGCHDIIMTMADYMESNFIKLMQESPYFGIMINDSTDLSVRRSLIIYINLLINRSLENFFIHLNEMKQCDADSLT